MGPATGEGRQISSAGSTNLRGYPVDLLPAHTGLISNLPRRFLIVVRWPPATRPPFIVQGERTPAAERTLRELHDRSGSPESVRLRATLWPMVN